MSRLPFLTLANHRTDAFKELGDVSRISLKRSNRRDRACVCAGMAQDDAFHVHHCSVLSAEAVCHLTRR